MRTKVKICGLSRPAAVKAVHAAGADACGFVFYPPSPRALTPAEAAPLARLAQGLLRVGVFVDADDDLLAAAIAAGLDALQLQGAETPARVAEVQQRFHLPVWKAVGVATSADVAAATQQFAGADLLLFDARPHPDASRPGGNGLRFDWRILKGDLPANWGLAGGLGAGNVAAAIRLARPHLVDVSSGVETSPGVKDLAKIASFVEAARRV